MAVAGKYNSVKLWNTASLKEVASLKGHWPFAFSPDGKQLVVNTDDAILKVTALSATIAKPQDRRH